MDKKEFIETAHKAGYSSEYIQETITLHEEMANKGLSMEYETFEVEPIEYIPKPFSD